MKNVMRTMLVAALAVFSVTSSMAQKGDRDKRAEGKRGQLPAAEQAKKQTERMRRELDLTAEQAAKVEAINLKYAEKREAEIKASAEKREEKMNMRRAVADEQQAELKAVLTEEQFQKLESNRKERAEKQGERKGRSKESKRSDRKKHDRRDREDKPAE